MRDITSKQISLRTATAQGMVICSDQILQIVRDDRLPKGNLFDVARAAAFLGAKQTHSLIPHCHPVSIDGLQVDFNIQLSSDTPLPQTSGILIQATGKSIGRTGIEMEVLTAVTIAALTIYDLLKPLGNKHIEIGCIKLCEKTGGKSDREKHLQKSYTAAVLVCSDATASGKRKDASGIAICDILNSHGCQVNSYQIIPDDKKQIITTILAWVDLDIPFIFTTGGTGLGPRDYTVDVVRSILERDASGISEAMRVHGQMRTPLAMLSRSIAGSIKKSLIVTLPGSTKGAIESLDAILPALFHAREMMNGGGH